MNEFNLEKDRKIASGFKVPEQYFEDFSAKVRKQLPEKEPKLIALLANKKTWFFAVAAVVVVALTVPIFHLTPSAPAELDKDTLENYLNHSSDFSDDDLAEFLNESDIQKIDINSAIEDKAIEDLLSTNDNLEEYLVN
ncbi:MAG: hypothetical protein H7199_10300 [Burkholderiales bacterium]|nr:hypothetical protein [Flavobacterium sp.]